MLFLLLAAVSFPSLQEKAAALAAKPYVAAVSKAPKLTASLDYDRHQKIHFKKERARDGVELFHPGKYFPLAVKIFSLEGKEIVFDKGAFAYDEEAIAQQVPADLGYAGLRYADALGDWLVFLGASYFRSAGEQNQYGLSARGVAVNTGLGTPEEFPRFSELYFGPSELYAVLDGPSVSGAYHFQIKRAAGVHMQVEACLFMRKAVQRIGIAPLTSMYWFSESNRAKASDWRPEVHDSDGLLLATGTGERIWRPLANPPRVDTSSFLDAAPKGFGLMQRDRRFESYEDDGVFYEKRPNLWVEPQAGFEKGAVQLIEIPTDDEVFDNIVAYWLPDPLPQAGEKRCFSYALHWSSQEPESNVAKVIATRTGKGGIPGHPRPAGVVKFALDFAGGPLEQRQKGDKVEPVISLIHGKLQASYALQIVGGKRWRAVFDVKPEGNEPVLLRAFLRYQGAAQSETWLYTLHP